MFHYKARGGEIAQTRACRQGILDMFGEGIVPGKDGCNATLGKCAGAIEQGFLGDNGDFLPVGKLKPERQPSQSAADYQGVKLHCISHLPECSFVWLSKGSAKL